MNEQYKVPKRTELNINQLIMIAIDIFKKEDIDTYYMYKLNDLTDFEILQIVTSPSIESLWEFTSEE